MRFLTLLVTAFGALAAAQSGANPLVPIEGSVTSGQPVAIKWKPTTSGTISLQLRWGNSFNLDPGTSIVAGATNSGSYTWTPPSSLQGRSDYTVEIIDDTNKDATNYSPIFTLVSYGTGLASSTMTMPGSSSVIVTSGTTMKTSAGTTITETTKGTTQANTGSTRMTTGGITTIGMTSVSTSLMTSITTNTGNGTTVTSSTTKMTSSTSSSRIPGPTGNSGAGLNEVGSFVAAFGIAVALL